MQKITKNQIAIVIVVTVVLLPVMMIAGFAYYIGTTKGHCANYARQHAHSDMEHGVLYDRCLSERGLPGW